MKIFKRFVPVLVVTAVVLAATFTSAAFGADQDMKNGDKAVMKSSKKSGKGVGKSSKSVAKDTAEVGAVGGIAMERGAKNTVKAPAKLVRKVRHTSKSKPKAQ